MILAIFKLELSQTTSHCFCNIFSSALFFLSLRTPCDSIDEWCIYSLARWNSKHLGIDRHCKFTYLFQFPKSVSIPFNLKDVSICPVYVNFLLSIKSGRKKDTQCMHSAIMIALTVNIRFNSTDVLEEFENIMKLHMISFVRNSKHS